jgi:Tfp pilus assembly protein PilE
MPEFAKRGRARAFALRALRRVTGEAGDTMIEVMVAALIVALIAAAVFVGFGSVAAIAGAQRHQAEASTLAQQDEERMRGLSVTELSAGDPAAPSCSTAALVYGNECYTQTVNGEPYTITSTAKFVSASGGGASCTSSATGNADYIETASTVTWAHSNDGRPPVIEHSLISPHVGGGLVIQVTDGSQPTPRPVSSAQINVTGSDTGTLTLTTDSNGCVVFAGLPGGTYTVSWPGYIQKNTDATSASVLVVDGNTETDSYQLGQPGTIQASFTTSYPGKTNVAATTDTFVASNSQLSSPDVSGIASSSSSSSSYSSTISSGATIFPLAGTNDAYSVYAGECAGDAPPSPTQAVVTAAGTTMVTVPEPAMLVDVYGNTTTEVDDPAGSGSGYTVGYTGSWTHQTGAAGNYNNTQSYSNSSGGVATLTFTGTSVTWITSTSNNKGNANVALYNASNTLIASATVNAYSSATVNQVPLWSSSTLTDGTYTLKITVPAGGTYVAVDAYIIGGPLSLLSTKPNITLTDTNCGGNETYPPEQIPTSVQKGALVNPGEPYGNFTVCADNGSVMNTATVANTNFTSTANTVNVYLNSNATGLASGTCT